MDAIVNAMGFGAVVGMSGVLALWMVDEWRFEREQREFFNRPGRRKPKV